MMMAESNTAAAGEHADKLKSEAGEAFDVEASQQIKQEIMS